MINIVGSTAGKIWKYLDKNGPISIAKLIKETKIDEKISSVASVGWLKKIRFLLR